MSDTHGEYVHDEHQRMHDFEEHGQRWAECLDCGAQWSVQDTNRGQELEGVSHGDETCLARYEEKSDAE